MAKPKLPADHMRHLTQQFSTARVVGRELANLVDNQVPS
jgi:hypothetical protein